MGKIQFQGEECSKEIKRRSILSMLSPPKKEPSEKKDKVADHASITVDEKGCPKAQPKKEFDSEDGDSQDCNCNGNLNKAHVQVKVEDEVGRKRQKIQF